MNECVNEIFGTQTMDLNEENRSRLHVKKRINKTSGTKGELETEVEGTGARILEVRLLTEYKRWKKTSQTLKTR